MHHGITRDLGLPQPRCRVIDSPGEVFVTAYVCKSEAFVLMLRCSVVNSPLVSRVSRRVLSDGGEGGVDHARHGFGLVGACILSTSVSAFFYVRRCLIFISCVIASMLYCTEVSEM